MRFEKKVKMEKSKNEKTKMKIKRKIRNEEKAKKNESDNSPDFIHPNRFFRWATEPVFLFQLLLQSRNQFFL